jgi:two-component system, cell cycle sensor histidine kinase and response regulator CckA
MLDLTGGVRWISDEATLIRDPLSGSPVWSGILIDITAEKELEQRLRQAQRMEAVGQLAGGIAHDFNNLLTVIRGYGALIRGDVAARGDDTADADELIRAADRATALTGQLLTFGRRQVLQPRVLDPAAVVGDLTPMLQRLLGDHVTLVATAMVDPVHVRIDRSQLEQVVVNLAINARDAMPDGGRLTIAVERVEPVPRRAGDESLARISVSDTGMGMDELVRSQIFEPFFTTKSQGKGTGLGLPTVLGIVSEAGGRITCESAPGHGTTFRIDLPAVDPPERPVDPGHDGSPAATDAPGGRGRVLLVEDQTPVRQVTARMLESLGYAVVEAPGGVEALMALEREPALVLLITDVTMPGMLGPELAQRAVQRRPGLPVLLITGYAGEGRIAVDEGPFPVLAKPFDVGALARAARAVIEGTTGTVV